MNTPLEDNEIVIREARANMQRGVEQAGGRLILTDRRVIFEAHRFNVRSGTDIFPRADVTGVGTGWTKVFGLLPLAPNALLVNLANGRELRFVVRGRDAWAAAFGDGADAAR